MGLAERLRLSWPRLANRVLDSSLGRVLFAVDFRRISSQKATPTDRRLLIPPFGGGNIGDQAMLEAVLFNDRRAVDVVVSPGSKYRFEHVEHPDLKVHVLQSVLECRPELNGRGMRALGTLLANAGELEILGADIMDGSYRLREVRLRVHLLKLAAGRGLPAKIYGMSWSERANRHAIGLMRELPPEVDVYVRDPVSMKRLVQSGLDFHRSMDLCFSHPAVRARNPNRHSLLVDPRRRAVLNCSGLMLRDSDAITRQIAIARLLASKFESLTILPHAIRTGDDDLAVCRRVYDAVSDLKNVTLICEQLLPSQVLEVVSDSSLVVTGRMHLGVLSIGSGVPAFIMDTHGKVEGLLSEFGLEDFLISKPDRAVEDLSDRVENMWQWEPRARDQIKDNIDRVCAMALCQLTSVWSE